ncbi:glycosyltransferase family 4 protein [Candidatus Parcubacteria bacterium]|nr:MAG: glycosyltransferase family 4 protein [Candidatus Parcubacteria bacterium]
MKILSVSHIFPNRVLPNYGVFIKERLKALSKLVETNIISPVPSFPFINLFDKYKNYNKIPYIDFLDSLSVCYPKFFLFPKYFNFLDGYFYFHSTNSFFSEQILKKNIDLLDFHWVYPDAYAGLKWAKKFNKKIVVTIRGNESICYYENSLRKKLLINTLQNVDHIISVSNELERKVIEEYGIKKDRVTVIPNGIEPEKFKSIDKIMARKYCGLDKDKKYILSLSRLSHEKGLEYLFEAFAFLKVNNAELVVVGDGPLNEALHNMSLKLGIRNKVNFIGSVSHDETINWYNAADVYCLPSLWEGCPNVIIESLACGTPVVSTKVGGIPDLVPNDDYGYLVPAGESGDLAVALNRALNKNWDCQKIAHYGSRNTWDNVADRVVEVFHKVL